MAKRRFLLNIPVPYLGEVVIFHACDKEGARVDYPAIVFGVKQYPLESDPNPGVLELRVLAIDGDAFVPAANYGRKKIGHWSRPDRQPPITVVVEIDEDGEEPDHPEAPEWYRKALGL